MLEKTGVPTINDIEAITPSAERRAKGPIAVVECFQKIPCNPCYTSCKNGAMKELIDINDLPEVYGDKCNGCGVCVSNCPGLAIVVIDETYSDTEATVRLPYEFDPLPEQGDFVTGLDREGNQVCRAKVVKVLNSKMMDRTSVVTLAVPKEHAMTVRFFEQSDCCAQNNYLCRCEEVSLSEVRHLIQKGCTTVDEIKRLSRAGMGPCQGRTCRQLIMNEIALATGVKPVDQKMVTYRPPVKPIKMSIILEDCDNE